MQVLVVIISLNLISLLVEKYNRERQENLAYNEFRKSVLNNINQTFVKARRIHKLFRSRFVNISTDSGLIVDKHVKFQELHEYVKELIEVRYEILSIKQEFTAYEFAFSNLNRQKENLTIIEKYFIELVNEYLEKLPELQKTPKNVGLNQFKKLIEYIGPFEQSEERRQIEERYIETVATITNDIVRAYKPEKSYHRNNHEKTDKAV